MAGSLPAQSKDVPGRIIDDAKEPDSQRPLALIEPACGSLGARAQLHIVEGADHSFHVLKRSGRTDEDVLDELAVATRRFAERLVQ